MTNHYKALKKHDCLVDLCKSLLITQGLPVLDHVEYDHGELDVLCRSIYYEVKSNYSPKSAKKAINQIERAIKYKKASYGYMVTYDGVYDVLD